jgi:methylase of polypeptide subunit release factors
VPGARGTSLQDPPLADLQAAALLAQALRRVGFDAAALASVLGGGKEDPALFDARAAQLPAPLATAMRLFVLGRPVARSEAKQALTPDGLEAAESLRVVAPRARRVAATLRIVPHDVLLLASDLPAPRPLAQHVASAHLPSLTLARLTVRNRVERALDIGTGNGIQALLLSRHADRVVATDVNERALRFAELNAALNGCTNVETRAGGFLEPVAGERFGTVVCSPPYVVSPESQLLYRDAGVRGDVLSEQLVRDVPEHLEDGGFATVLVSWVPAHGDEEPAPVRWAADGPCDTLVLELHREQARDAAAEWHRDLEPTAAAQGIARWLDFYRRECIEEIAYGAVVLRKSSGATWQDAIPLPGGPAGHAGEHLRRMFAARSLLANGAVHGRRFAPAPDVVLRDDALAMRGGLGLRAGLDPTAAALVHHLAQSRSAAQAFDATAGALGRDPAELRAVGEALVGRLVELGLVVPLGQDPVSH